MILLFLAPRSLPSFFSEYTSAYGLIRLPWRIVKKYIYILWSAGKATTGLATNLHGQLVPQILFIAQLTLSPPAFYVYRRLGAAVLSAGSPFYRLVQSCRRLLSTVPVHQASFGCRCSSGTVPFIYLTIFFICSVSPVCPFLPLLFASGLRSEKRLFFPLSHSLCCSLLFRSPVHALRYKRYTFFRPGFEGFLPSPPRLAPIFAWLSSYIVRFYYLCPF